MLATQKEFSTESPEILEAKDYLSQVWRHDFSSPGLNAFESLCFVPHVLDDDKAKKYVYFIRPG